MVSQWPCIRVMLQVRKVGLGLAIETQPFRISPPLPGSSVFGSTSLRHFNLINVVPSFFSDIPSQSLDKHQLHVTTVRKCSNQITMIKFEPQ